ncbi:hypothetical protein [Spirosoma fluminis]
MKAATERKLIRWFPILASIPILGYIYGPVATLPEPAFGEICDPARRCTIGVLAMAVALRTKMVVHC